MQELRIRLQRAKYCPGGRVLDSALGPGFVHMCIAAPSGYLVLEVTRYLVSMENTSMKILMFTFRLVQLSPGSARAAGPCPWNKESMHLSRISPWQMGNLMQLCSHPRLQLIKEFFTQHCAIFCFLTSLLQSTRICCNISYPIPALRTMQPRRRWITCVEIFSVVSRGDFQGIRS